MNSANRQPLPARSRLSATLLGTALFVATVAPAVAQVGVSAKVGTLGFGADLTFGLSENVNVRLGGNILNYSFDTDYSDVDFDTKLDLKSALLLLDWHPRGHVFRVTGGIGYNGNDIDLRSTPRNGTYRINGVTYTASEIGTLRGRAKFNSVAPYVGVGFGNAISPNRRWSIAVDLGVLIQGDPDLTYSADGTLASDPTFQANLEAERRDAQDDLGDLAIYPVASIGFSYRF